MNAVFVKCAYRQASRWSFFLKKDTAFSRSNPYLSGNPVPNARGQAGVRIFQCVRAKNALLDWITVNSRLCAVSLNVPLPYHNSPCLFVTIVHVQTDYCSSETEDQFYWKLSQLCLTDVLVVAVCFNANMFAKWRLKCISEAHFRITSPRTTVIALSYFIFEEHNLLWNYSPRDINAQLLMKKLFKHWKAVSYPTWQAVNGQFKYTTLCCTYPLLIFMTPNRRLNAFMK